MSKVDPSIQLAEHLGVDPLSLLNSVIARVTGVGPDVNKQADELLKMIEDTDVIPHEMAYLSLIGIGTICEALTADMSANDCCGECHDT